MTIRWFPSRRLVFYALALIVVMCPLVLIELLFRLVVAAPPIDSQDPYVAFSGIRPLFVLNKAGTHYETAEERLTYFRKQSFTAEKRENQFRIFCLGGSTVQGRPYSVETSFTEWLRLNLQAVQPAREFEVINCGGISYASYRLVPILREVLTHEPDLLIVYTGHNEFLEDRTYAPIKRIPPVLLQMHEMLKYLRSYSTVYHALVERQRENQKAEQAMLPVEVQAKLDFEEGLAWYHRDDEWRSTIIQHFRYNLKTMVHLAREAEIPLILMNPVSNLKDCPPFKSVWKSNLTDIERSRVNDLWVRVQNTPWDDVFEKIQLLNEALEIDDRHAGMSYTLGLCYERVGRLTEAKPWFVKAKDEDICPLRMLESMHEVITDVATTYTVPFVDIKGLIENQSEGGIPGHEWLIDHVHPRIKGHQLIADQLITAIGKLNIIQFSKGWHSKRDVLWKDHLSNLNQVYYEQGAMRLKRVQNWSRGVITEPERSKK